MTREENIRAILEAHFIGFRDDLIDSAVKRIEALSEPTKTDSWSIKDVTNTFQKHGLIREQEPCEDAVSRKAVLEIIEREEFKGDALSEIEKLPPVTSKPKTEWIPVSEKLPEEYICDDGYIEPSKSVLVTMKSGLMRVSRYWGSKDKECPWIDLSYPTTEEVLAWMPLPEPYNAEMESEE